MAWHLDKAVYAGGGGDYTTLQSFESAMDGEDASGTDGIRGRVKGNPADGNYVYWGGWQAGYDSDTWLVIEAESGSEADGLNDASGDDALLTASQQWTEPTEAIYVKYRYLELEGKFIQIENDGGGEARVIKCVFRDGTLHNVYISGLDSAYVVYVGVCLVKNISGNYGTGVYLLDADGTVVVINSTLVDFSGSFPTALSQSAGSATAKNCALAGNTTDVGGTWSETTNKSEDDGDITFNDADDFTEPSTEDYTIYDTNSNLYHTGTQIADSWFTEECATDLAGTTWNNPPSVGCFEYVAAGGNAPTGHFDGPLMGPFGGPI